MPVSLRKVEGVQNKTETTEREFTAPQLRENIRNLNLIINSIDTGIESKYVIKEGLSKQREAIESLKGDLVGALEAADAPEGEAEEGEESIDDLSRQLDEVSRDFDADKSFYNNESYSMFKSSEAENVNRGESISGKGYDEIKEIYEANDDGSFDALLDKLENSGVSRERFLAEVESIGHRDDANYYIKKVLEGYREEQQRKLNELRLETPSEEVKMRYELSKVLKEDVEQIGRAGKEVAQIMTRASGLRRELSTSNVYDVLRPFIPDQLRQFPKDIQASYFKTVIDSAATQVREPNIIEKLRKDGDQLVREISEVYDIENPAGSELREHKIEGGMHEREFQALETQRESLVTAIEKLRQGSSDMSHEDFGSVFGDQTMPRPVEVSRQTAMRYYDAEQVIKGLFDRTEKVRFDSERFHTHQGNTEKLTYSPDAPSIRLLKALQKRGIVDPSDRFFDRSKVLSNSEYFNFSDDTADRDKLASALESVLVDVERSIADIRDNYEEEQNAKRQLDALKKHKFIE